MVPTNTFMPKEGQKSKQLSQTGTSLNETHKFSPEKKVQPSQGGDHRHKKIVKSRPINGSTYQHPMQGMSGVHMGDTS
jgi:hypothetical protein